MSETPPLLTEWFLEHGTMIGAHNQIWVNLRASAVHIFALFVIFCGYSRHYSYED
ncbi:MAG: hypothetical protein JOZ31_25075 [Verrucomicrobia bacterium]|nr:hypothetical protein [Verrucomicrobiota bacterium]MBV8483316.1 hypothetical protein [Verrucomicrobiota bacterium]